MGKGMGFAPCMMALQIVSWQLIEAGVVLPVGEGPSKNQGLRHFQASQQVSNLCRLQPATNKYNQVSNVPDLIRCLMEFSFPFPALIFISQRTSPSVLNDGLEWKLCMSA